LQEVNVERAGPFLKRLLEKAELKKKRFKIIQGLYFGDKWAIWTIIDTDKFPDYQQITPLSYPFFDPDKPWSTDVRALSAVYLKTSKLLAVNVHAPHEINMEKSLRYALQNLKLYHYDIETVVMGGDFNDAESEMLNKNWSVSVTDSIRVSMVKGITIPKTCCTDSKYTLHGDYLLWGSIYPIVFSKFGLPSTYKRWDVPISDHDPLEAVIDIKKSFQLKTDYGYFACDYSGDIGEIYVTSKREKAVTWAIDKSGHVCDVNTGMCLDMWDISDPRAYCYKRNNSPNQKWDMAVLNEFV
jgi:hypothetical protein